MVAAAIVGGTAVSAVAAHAGSKSIARSTEKAADISNGQYLQTREDMTPWREAGEVALGQLAEGTKDGGIFNRNFTLQDFVKDPGYDFRLQEGTDAVEASAAARGGALSGGALKELTRFGQKFASNEYNNAYNRWNNDITTRFNRLSGVAGTGQTAARDVAAAGADNARTVGDMITSGASARASGYAGVANSVNNGVSNLANWYQSQQLLAALNKNGG